MKKKLATLFFLLPFAGNFAQINPNAMHEKSIQYGQHKPEEPCISNNEYAEIERRCAANELQLAKVQKKAAPVLLSWPLKASPKLKDCGFYRVSAYVDHNAASGAFQDFNCGTNSYDGHKGTDIASFPFNFYKMDSNFVEVIAAASGTILDKHDGEFDRNCTSNTLTANYVILQHEDGSRTLYWHMKKNFVTTKAIGQTVAQGEYLGVVGSSGSSSGPHLHFEVWTGSTSSTSIDPFAGTCNTKSLTSKWATQKPVKETAIIKASANCTDIVLPPCPATETLNECNYFLQPFQGTSLPAGFAKFYICIRDEVSGLTADLAILNPDNSIHTTWTYASTATVGAKYFGWSKKLPTVAGKYTFRAIYNGITCSFPFEVATTNGLNTIENASQTLIYPNPSNGKIHVEIPFLVQTEICIYNAMGALVFKQMLNKGETEISLTEKSGIYFYTLESQNQTVGKGKLTIE